MSERIVCLGECLVDILPSGSPQPGGAPANVAFHAVAAGVSSGLVSRVGADARGRDLCGRLAEGGLAGDLLQVDALHATGAVHVRSDHAGPSYDILAPAAWDFIDATDGALEAVTRADVVVFGTLAQRHPVSRATIRKLVGRARSSGAFAVADLNLRAPFFDAETVLWTMRHADLLKLNREELSVVSPMLGATGETMALFEGLVREFGLRHAVLTCGRDGAWFFDDRLTWHQAASPADTVDTVGAGDAFTAVLAVARACGVGLKAAAPLAAEVAAHVVSQPGAMPEWPKALAGRVRGCLGTAA